jgi:hypothetical protein
MLCLLFAGRAQAAPIEINFEGGCLTSFPGGVATWRSTTHFRFAEFWDLEAGCASTTAIGVTFYERFDNFDGTGGLFIRQLQSRLPLCGRGQIDWQEYIEGTDKELGGLGAIVFNTGVNCSQLAPPPPTSPGTPGPPFAPPPEQPFLLTPGPPLIPTTPELPLPQVVPEPGTLALVGLGLGVGYWKRRRASR